MEYSVPGEDISPEEYNNQKLWTLAIKDHDFVHLKKKNVTALVSCITTGDSNGKAAEIEKSAAGC